MLASTTPPAAGAEDCGGELGWGVEGVGLWKNFGFPNKRTDEVSLPRPLLLLS